MAGAARIDRLLKKRNAGFPPQAPSEQQRRVGGGGQQRRGDRLGQVVHRSELIGADLVMHLEAGAAGFEHHRVVLDDQFVQSFEPELVVAAAQPAHRVVQGG